MIDCFIDIIPGRGRMFTFGGAKLVNWQILTADIVK